MIKYTPTDKGGKTVREAILLLEGASARLGDTTPVFWPFVR